MQIYANFTRTRDHAKEHSVAAKAVYEKFYMDDCLNSMESPDDALKRSRHLVRLPGKGGLKLAKFISNEPRLLGQPEDQSIEPVPNVIGASMDELSSHLLGLKWKDTLVVKRSIRCNNSKPVTHRLVLRLVAKVFEISAHTNPGRCLA